MESGKEVCLICLKNNYDDKSLMLFDLSTVEWKNISYLNKLEFVLNAEIVVYDSTLICSCCLNDLNHAYEFKERVAKALDYWSVKLEDNVNAVNIKNDVIEVVHHEDNSEINEVEGNCLDNNEISETENTNALNDDNNTDLNESSDFSCSKCSCTFPTASELINHDCGNLEPVESKQSVQKSNKCIKKQKSDGLYCDVCDLHFTKRWKLNKHIKGHMEDKKYTCTYCDRSFKQSCHLREHMTSHTGEHNFMCSVCGKKFQRISSQRRHMRTHEALPGEKSKKSPFLCNICGKRFPYSNGAQRHMRIHTGDRRYKCEVCHRKFSQSTHLKVHLRIHTGEKPYMCSTCGESFAIKASLHKHMKGHNETKNDIIILHNLEPNLSRTESKGNGNNVKKEELLLSDMYDQQGFLITCGQ